MKQISVFLLFLLLSYASIAQNKGMTFEEGTWTEILQKAQNEKKPIFLDCYASWCGPCKWMAKNVFTDNNVGIYMNSHFINVEIDMEKGEGKTLAKTYGIRAYPTLLFLDMDGSVLHRVCGAREPENFLAAANDALRPGKRFKEYQDKYDKGNRDGYFLKAYINKMNEGCMDYKPVLDAYWKSQKDEQLINEANWQMMQNFLQDKDSREFNFLLTNDEAFRNKYGAEDVDALIYKIYAKALIQAAGKDEERYNKLRNEVSSHNFSLQEKAVLEGDLALAENKSDWPGYGALAGQLANQYYTNDANNLNQLAWTVYENIDDPGIIQDALQWISRSIEVDRQYYNLDTYASLLFKAGKMEEARGAAEQAIDVAKAQGLDYSSTEALIKKISGDN